MLAALPLGFAVVCFESQVDSAAHWVHLVAASVYFVVDTGWSYYCYCWSH